MWHGHVAIYVFVLKVYDIVYFFLPFITVILSRLHVITPASISYCTVYSRDLLFKVLLWDGDGLVVTHTSMRTSVFASL